ncbi:hypothetical protein MHYP_G00005560 [Metynnis hypsauchen]
MCPKECKHVRQKERVQVSHRAFSPTQSSAKGKRSAHSGLNPVRTHKKCPHSITSVRVKARGTKIDLASRGSNTKWDAKHFAATAVSVEALKVAHAVAEEMVPQSQVP